MKFRTLQENLRKALWERIDAGELTGLHLAARTGFKQAHISNFLNRKRGLSLEGMDKVLSVQHLSVLDLIDSNEVNKRASVFPSSEREFDSVVVVDPEIAAFHAVIVSMHVKETLRFKKSFLKRLKTEMEGGRSGWERFVIIKMDTQGGMSMYPRTMPGAFVLIDRHYNSLIPYHKGEKNIYAVRRGKSCKVRYVEILDNNLILRPHNSDYPIELISLTGGQRTGDYIVGRVCYVGAET
jgi:Peptidase S24-like